MKRVGLLLRLVTFGFVALTAIVALGELLGTGTLRYYFLTILWSVCILGQVSRQAFFFSRRTRQNINLNPEP